MFKALQELVLTLSLSSLEPQYNRIIRNTSLQTIPSYAVFIMNNNNNASNAGGADDRDYLDKGLEAVEKKFGGARFAGPDAMEKNRGMNEKITDTIRKLIEKVTGYVRYRS